MDKSERKSMGEEEMQSLRLTGRSAAVTGASSGLGKALCAALVAEGVSVTGISRGNSRTSFAHPDTWNPEDYDLVFFNSGFGMIYSSSQAIRVMGDVDEMFRVNLLNPIVQAQKALAAGAIHTHFVGSIISIVSSPLYALYAATKYGLRGWAYGAARELPGRVSISYPNGIRTHYFANLRGDPALLAQYAGQVEAAQDEYDTPEAVAAGIVEGIQWGAREIVPTEYALTWFEKNGEDVRRMWYPGLRAPSEQRWDWWEAVWAHIEVANNES